MNNTTPLALAAYILDANEADFNTLLQLNTEELGDLLMASLKWNAMFIKKAADSMHIEPGNLARTLINQVESADF